MGVISSSGPVLKYAPNFRDLGGLRTADGRKVRDGRLFRSEGLSRLDEADLACLQKIGVRTVIDLRASWERERFPSRWPEGPAPQILHLDVLTDVKALSGGVIDRLCEEMSVSVAVNAVLATYRALPFGFIGRLDQILALLADENSPPCIIHCQAGRDRTGFASAMLLLSLGVPVETILEDYMRTALVADPGGTSDLMAEMILKRTGRVPPREILDPILKVRAEYLQAALDSVTMEWGSLAAYLVQVGGLDEAKRERLAAAYLEGPIRC